MRRLSVTAAVLLAALLGAPSALGAGALPVTSMSPAQSTNVAAGSTVTFKVVSECVNQPMYVEVANANVKDPDDTLANSAQQDYLSMEAQPDGSYTATARGSSWLNTPGTYFWQASINGICGGLDKLTWVSDVLAIVVTSPTTAAGTDVATEVQDNGELLTIAQARSAITDAVLKATKKVARGLKRTCTRRGSGSVLAVVCSASWNDKKKYRYNGLWRMALNDDGSIEARFDGRRATLACIKKARRTGKSQKGCYKRWRKTVTIA